VPTTYWTEPFTVTFHGCGGGSGTATLIVHDDGYTQTVNLAEGSSGVYSATFAAPYPHHGTSSVSWSLGCGTTGGFDLYIDPSGTVKTTSGDPLAGATVTLFRSDDPGGPFVEVPSGSPIMSPSNQANPDMTNAAGGFGWDVLAGFYKVRAEKAGCAAPGGSGVLYVESDVLTIPPPVTDLTLTLACTTPPGRQPPPPPSIPPTSTPPAPTPPTTPPEPDTVAPVITGLRVTPSVFATPGLRPAGVLARPAIGTTIRYRLSERATVRFTFQQVLAGRLQGGHCVAARRGRKGKACARFRTIVTVRRAGTGGVNGTRFSGWIGTTRLPAGPYRVALVATDGAGNRSQQRTARFRIVRAR
jgi:hypothetical protein